MRAAATACAVAAGVVMWTAAGCLYPRGLDREVERAVARKAQREVPGSGRSVDDAFAGIPSDRQARHVELDAATALRLATQYGRGLQAKRDALFLSGLATVGKRREFGFQYSGTLDYVLTQSGGSNDTTSVQAELKVTRLLPSGATLTAEAAESKTTADGDGTNATPYAASASVELRQPLLAGAGYRASHEGLTQAGQRLEKIGGGGLSSGQNQLVLGHGGGLVWHAGMFKDGADGIQAEAIHPQVEPKTHCIPHGLFEFRVAPVEVGLLFEEVVVVVLAGLRVVLPG